MNRSRYLAAMAIAAVCSLSLAQDVGLMATSSDPGIRAAAAIKLTDLTNLLGTRTTWRLSAIGDQRMLDGRLSGGFALTTERRISREITVRLGPVLSFAAGKPTDVGLVVLFATR